MRDFTYPLGIFPLSLSISLSLRAPSCSTGHFGRVERGGRGGGGGGGRFH